MINNLTKALSFSKTSLIKQDSVFFNFNNENNITIENT